MVGPQSCRGAHRLREANRRAAPATLRSHSAPPRPGLARELRISPTPAPSVVADLRAADLVREAPASTQGQRGRPARLLELATPPGVVVGVDIGRRHARVAVATRDESVLAEEYVPVPAGQDRERTTRVVQEYIDVLLERTGQADADRPTAREQIRSANVCAPVTWPH